MSGCPHEPRPYRICEHLLAAADPENPPPHRIRFLGSDFVPACPACADVPVARAALVPCCDECRLPYLRTDTFGNFDGFAGTPEPRVRDAGLVLIVETADPRQTLGEAILSLAPVPDGGRAGWLALTESYRLVLLELPAGRIVRELPVIPTERLPRTVAPDPDRAHDSPYPALHVSPDGRFAAVLMERTRHGVVIDLANGAALLTLDRKDYHPDVSGWPFAFFRRDGKTLAVHAVDWNLLRVTDLDAGLVLATESEGDGDDYFLGPITVNPSGTRLATAGWVWQPVGILKVISLDRLLGASEIPSEHLNQTGYHWNGPNLWLDDARLLVWGLGDDDRRMVDAGIVFDLSNARVEIAALWPGLADGSLHADTSQGRVWSCGAETSVWDATTGERLAHALVRTHSFHPSLRHAAGIGEDGRISVVFLQRS